MVKMCACTIALSQAVPMLLRMRPLTMEPVNEKHYVRPKSVQIEMEFLVKSSPCVCTFCQLTPINNGVDAVTDGAAGFTCCALVGIVGFIALLLLLLLIDV